MRKLKLLTLLLLVLGPILSFAQVTTSSLTGTIQSETGAGLEGATITATHQPSGTVYRTSSRANGQFNIPNMRVGGPYQVVVTYVGYQSKTVGDINLKLAEAFVLNTALSTTGQTLTEVTVTTTNPNSVLNANRTGSTTNIGTAQIQRMPSITRSMNDLVRLTPQANSTSTGPAIGGGNYRQNYITVDGADFNNAFGIGGNLPANGSPISLDALEEISINVTPYDIRQSGFIGSAINAVTRAGTNNFSGSVYTFFRNQDQQGNKVGFNAPLVRQNLQENTYGFRFGGPIIKNKLFFFLNAESGKRVQPGQTSVAATPSAPFGSSPNVTRPTVAELDMISNYLRTTYGYETGPYQGYDNESENTRMVARVDWNINTKNRFNIRYSQVESKSPSFVSTSRSPLTAYANGAGRTNNNALWFKNSNYFQEANFYSLSSEWNSTFGKVANTLRATFTHQNDPRSTESADFPFFDILAHKPISRELKMAFNVLLPATTPLLHGQIL
jgi:hypothetical protein